MVNSGKDIGGAVVIPRKTESGAAIKFGRLVLHCSSTISSAAARGDNKADGQQSQRYASETALGIDVDNDRPSSTTIGDFEIFALALPSKGCHDGRNLEKGSWSISGDASASRWTPLPPRQPIGLNNRSRTSHSSPSRIVP